MVIQSGGVARCTIHRVKCASCGSTYRGNFVRKANTEAKTNVLTYKQMAALGVYFVTPNFGFAVDYLGITRRRLLFGRLAPGQEAQVIKAHFGSQGAEMPTAITIRDHLLHAIEGLSLAMREPESRSSFDIEYPASLRYNTRGMIMFPSTPGQKVRALAFDGHFGVHRALEPGVDVRILPIP